MTGPAAFLLARLAESEENAYDFHVLYTCDVFTYFNEGGLPCTCGNPARVLRQVAAMRRVVEEYRAVTALLDGPRRLADYGAREALTASVLLRVICALAAIWADHPDYREEWAL